MAASRYAPLMVNGIVVDDRLAGPLSAASPAIEAPLPAGRDRLLHPAAGMLEDGVLALLLAYAVPVGILLVGTPIALLARLAFELGARLTG
jgi:hypothetical protein